MNRKNMRIFWGQENCTFEMMIHGSCAFVIFSQTGRWIGRVHVISRPLTDYLRYEFAVYCRTVRAGEDVRLLDLTNRPNPGLPAQDFWLFDDTAIVRMDYDSDGNQLGRELLEDVDHAPYVAWKRLALEYAEPFTENWVKRGG